MRYLTMLLMLNSYSLFAGLPLQSAGIEAIALSGMQLFAGKSFVGINHISSHLPKTKTLAFASQKPYFMSEVHQTDLVFAIPQKHSVIAFYNRTLFAPSYFGCVLGSGIALALHPKIVAGIQSEYHFESVAGYGQYHRSLFKVCLTALPHPKYSSAWQIAVPGSSLRDKNRHLNHIFAIKYMVQPNIQISGEVQWQNKFKPSFKTGIRFQLKPEWELISGFDFGNGQFAAGIVRNKKHIQYGIAIRYHQVLGSGHALHIAYDW